MTRTTRIAASAVSALLVLSLTACGGAPKNAEEAPKPSEGSVAMKKAVKRGDYTIEVTSAKREAEAGDAKAAEGTEIVVIEVEIGNTGTNDISVTQPMFELKGTDGTVYERAQAGDKFFAEDDFVDSEDTKKFKLAYVIPAGRKGMQLTFSPRTIVGDAMNPVVIDIE